MEYLDLAKCGLLEQFTLASIGLPLWKTALVAFLVVLTHGLGILAARRLRHSSLTLCLTRAAYVSGGALVAGAFGAIVIGGIQYLVFLVRISKDGMFCTYFGAVHSLAPEQTFALLMLCIGNVALAAALGSAGGSMKLQHRFWVRTITSYIIGALTFTMCVLAEEPIPLAAMLVLGFAMVAFFVSRWRLLRN